MSDDTRRGLTKAQVREKLFELMCQNARVTREDLADEKSLRDDLHLDSLDFVGIVNEVEKEWKITIPDTEADKLKTVGDVVEALWSKLGSGGGTVP